MPYPAFSAPLRSPVSPLEAGFPAAQALADSDLCQVLPRDSPNATTTSLSVSAGNASQIQRARSGSRTYNEVQAEERELARRRTKSRERGERVPEDEDLANQEGLSYGELRAEMETLLSLRRRSMSQPLTVDPDLPPSAPATSSPPPDSASTSHAAGAPGMSSSMSSARPKLSLTINTSHLHAHPTGGPISPTAPSPAETGTLVRRKSSVSSARQKLPSEHPLPPTPPLPMNLTSPSSVSCFSSESSDSESSPLHETLFASTSLRSPTDNRATATTLSSTAINTTDLPSPDRVTPSSSYQPNIIRSTSISSRPTTSEEFQLSSGSGQTTDGSSPPPPSQSLFWLPASLHPELAPQEFKAFIREQTSPEALARRTSLGSSRHGGGVRGGPNLARSSSKLGPNGRIVNGGGGGGIGRRSSMLRGEYKPRINDGIQLQGDSIEGGVTSQDDGTNEATTTTSDSVRRNGSLKRIGSQSSSHSSLGGGGLAFEELTIRDLQRLEELAQRAEREQELKEGEGEGERLGRVLRRSLSLNPHRMAEAAVAAGAQLYEQPNLLSSSLPASYGSTLVQASSHDSSSPTGSILDDSNQEGDDFDSPLIVPPPGQILRRNARTKIRKTGPGGEISFGGHRSGGSRLGGGVGVRRGRTSSDSSALAGTPRSTPGEEDGTSSTGGDSASVESHEYTTEGGAYDLRTSTSSLSSISSQSRPLSAPGHSGPMESPPLDGTAQYLEIASAAPAIPHVEVQQPTKTASATIEQNFLPPVSKPVSPPPASGDVSSAAPVDNDRSSPPASTSAMGGVSPASAEYDWASEHLPHPIPQPIPKPQPKPYAVHPSHGGLPSLPPPTPQAVPVPQPERERSSSVSSSTSGKSNSTMYEGGRDKPKEKEKKSGWAAKLGLGSSEDKRKKGKGKEKEKDKDLHQRQQHQLDEKAETVMIEDRPNLKGTKEKSSSKESGGTSSSLFGGLFGRRRNEYDSHSNSSVTSSPFSSSANPGSLATAAALAPPPPPTASGALLPNGRYANFYRLPIHVERAIYRLSHIKLANPRRPLYEQVLISNLMFWYLGLIQKPQPSPPAAPPVPVPGRRNNQPNNNRDSSPAPVSNAGPSTPNSPKGNRSASSSRTAPSVPVGGRLYHAETPVKQVIHEHQGRESHGEHQPSRPEPPPVTITDATDQYQQSKQQTEPSYAGFNQPARSSDEARYSTLNERASQVAGTVGDADNDDDDDDDRPLAQARSASRSPQRASHSNSSSTSSNSATTPAPSSPEIATTGVSGAPPIAVSTVPHPSEASGFEVTSRRVTPPLGAHSNFNLNVASERDISAPEGADKRLSVLSNKSLSEIYEAYSLTGVGGNSGGEGLVAGATAPPRGSSLHATKELDR